MFIEEDWMTIGKVVSTKGIRGEIKIKPLSDFPERFTKPGKRWLQSKKEEPRKVDLIKGRQLPGKEIYVIQLAGINTMTLGKELIGEKLLIPADHRPELGDDEFHFLDLVGLEVKIQNDAVPIGKVSGLINGGNDLLEVKCNKGKTVLIPFVKAIVPEISLEKGWLIITPPPGLLDL